MDADTRRPREAGPAGLDLRSPSRFLDAGAGGGEPFSHVSGTCAETGGARAGHGLHARGAAPDCRTSVLWLVGLSGHQLLRADGTLRHAAGPDVPDRLSTPARNRCVSGLGAFPF